MAFDIPGASQVGKGECRRANNMYGGGLTLLLLLYDSFIWYEVRRCVFRCWCVGGENVIVVARSPSAALRQPHTYTIAGATRKALNTAAIVPLLLYCCCTTAVLLLYCCCTAVLHTVVPMLCLRGSAAAYKNRNAALS